MACSPDGTRPLLNYVREEEIILNAVGDLKREKRLEIDSAEGGSLEELVHLLADQDCHVVHLSGRGYYNMARDADYRIMESESGARKEVDARALADALVGRPSVRLLFFAACETGRELTSRIPPLVPRHFKKTLLDELPEIIEDIRTRVLCEDQVKLHRDAVE